MAAFWDDLQPMVHQSKSLVLKQPCADRVDESDKSFPVSLHMLMQASPPSIQVSVLIMDEKQPPTTASTDAFAPSKIR